jgi:hypothetical protein
MEDSPREQKNPLPEEIPQPLHKEIKFLWERLFLKESDEKDTEKVESKTNNKRPSNLIVKDYSLPR